MKRVSDHEAVIQTTRTGGPGRQCLASSQPQQTLTASEQPCETPTSERLAGLDAARGILMLLGIVIHAAFIYGYHPWRVHDATATIAFDYVVEGIHAFRMEAFFWIAGFFAAMNLDRTDYLRYQRNRLPRLVVPLLATLCTLNVIEYLLVAPFLPSPTSNNWIGHLWFLVDLIVFSLGILPLIQRDGIVQRTVTHALCCARTPLELVTLLALSTVLFQVLSEKLLGWHLNIEIIGLTSPRRLLTYAPYFAFGMIIQRTAGLRRLFSEMHPVWLIPGVTLHAWLVINASTSSSGTLLKISLTVLTWLCIASVIALIERCFSRTSRTTAWLADSAYPVYLSHHVLVVAIGTSLLDRALPVTAKFILVLGLATIGSIAFYEVCKHVKWMRALFTGQVEKGARSGLQSPR